MNISVIEIAKYTNTHHNLHCIKDQYFAINILHAACSSRSTFVLKFTKHDTYRVFSVFISFATNAGHLFSFLLFVVVLFILFYFNFICLSLFPFFGFQHYFCIDNKRMYTAFALFKWSLCIYCLRLSFVQNMLDIQLVQLSSFHCKT